MTTAIISWDQPAKTREGKPGFHALVGSNAGVHRIVVCVDDLPEKWVTGSGEPPASVKKNIISKARARREGLI